MSGDDYVVYGEMTWNSKTEALNWFRNQLLESVELLKLCRDVVDDELENRSARHSLDNLHARLVTKIQELE